MHYLAEGRSWKHGPDPTLPPLCGDLSGFGVGAGDRDFLYIGTQLL